MAAFFAWRFFRFQRVKKRLPELLAQGAVVLDVRSRDEFASGNSPGSVNIPLQELPGKSLDWDRARPVVVCCASGTRSGMAVGILKGKGFQKVLNAGPWANTLP
ncbi:MAG: hypothetical protein A2506_13205 [Elusimicrobia bacterium RIFOXYD12_FULL_66_9]|nr:MAG: hypothetical protein A2506_13205 [Elusimicrobia bacterium RIFOXYD12_FULL_66_9]